MLLAEEKLVNTNRRYLHGLFGTGFGRLLLCSSVVGIMTTVALVAHPDPPANTGKPGKRVATPSVSGARTAGISPPQTNTVPAPTGFGDLKLKMTRKDVQALLKTWKARTVRSDNALGEDLLSLPDHAPYTAFRGFRAIFNDRRGVHNHPWYPARGSAVLRRLELEFKEQRLTEASTILDASLKRFGAPVGTTAVPVSIGESGFEFGASWRFKRGTNVTRWEWPDRDVRVELSVALYEETFTPALIIETGMIFRDRWEKEVKTTVERLEKEKSQQLAAQVRDTLLTETGAKDPPPPPKAKIRFLNQEFEAASVVYVIGGNFYKEWPWLEMQRAITESIKSLPDGVRFQINDELPPRGLLPSSKETRSLAAYFLHFGLRTHAHGHSDQPLVSMNEGGLESRLRAAADLLPELLIVATNLDGHGYRAAREGPRSEMVDYVTNRTQGKTTAHVFCWTLPGTMHATDPGPPLYKGVHNYPVLLMWHAWEQLVAATGGNAYWVHSHNYFWGRGPEVEVRWLWKHGGYPEEWKTAKGPIVYADEDEMWVRAPAVSYSSELTHWRIPRDCIEGKIRVLSPLPADQVPTALHTFLPEGAITHDSRAPTDGGNSP